MKLKPLVLYIDTSVIGGYFDIEFEKETQSLFDLILNGKCHILYSSVTEDEIFGSTKASKRTLK